MNLLLIIALFALIGLPERPSLQAAVDGSRDGSINLDRKSRIESFKTEGPLTRGQFNWEKVRNLVVTAPKGKTFADVVAEKQKQEQKRKERALKDGLLGAKKSVHSSPRQPLLESVKFYRENKNIKFANTHEKIEVMEASMQLERYEKDMNRYNKIAEGLGMEKQTFNYQDFKNGEKTINEIAAEKMKVLNEAVATEIKANKRMTPERRSAILKATNWRNYIQTAWQLRTVAKLQDRLDRKLTKAGVTDLKQFKFNRSPAILTAQLSEVKAQKNAKAHR